MEDNKDTQADQASDKATNEDNEAKSFTQDQLNDIVSKRLGEFKSKAEKEFAEKLANEKAEAERLAKLSSEERERELTTKQLQELATKERELSIRENKLSAIAELDEAKIPLKFVEFVADADIAKQQERLNTLKGEWQNAVSEEVKRQLAGTPPKDIKTSGNSIPKKPITIL